ncbi:DUF3135 domain-containing protein [Vibrio sp. WXL103]|uniref:DUF3135 domain-containing protein n=1 Tax=Vibrio sp. WXL103 TaxID=3450710 RepID=UPI003EC4F20E
MTTHPALPSFDELAELAQKDPKAFDELKASLCQACIDASSPQMQQRLRAQQSHLDRLVSQSKNPIHANVLLRRELLVQFQKFRQVLSEGKLDDKQGNVIEFRGREDSWR